MVVRGRVVLLCGLGVCGLLGVSLASCGGAGPVTIIGAPTPAAPDRAACADLVVALPASLGEGLDRREVEPPVASAAAFGSEPAVLTCGAAGVAAGYQPTSMLSEIDGVGWFSEDLGDQGVRYSTPTRTPQVVLTLPAGRQSFEALVAVAPAIRDHTTVTAG